MDANRPRKRGAREAHGVQQSGAGARRRVGGPCERHLLRAHLDSKVHKKKVAWAARRGAGETEKSSRRAAPWSLKAVAGASVGCSTRAEPHGGARLGGAAAAGDMVGVD